MLCNTFLLTKNKFDFNAILNVAQYCVQHCNLHTHIIFKIPILIWQNKI